MIEWRTDMDKAPRDGTKILLWGEVPALNGWPQIGHYYVNSLFGPSWDWDDNGSCNLDVPTHWAAINKPA